MPVRIQSHRRGHWLLIICLLSSVLLIPNNALAGSYSYAPVSGRITSTFGWRVDPFHKGKRFHNGVDIAANNGQTIQSPQDGVVAFSGKYKGYGNMVLVMHAKNLYTLYGHTSKSYVRRGQVVRRGQALAAVGSSGRSTGPHLHFEVHHDNKRINPLKYLSVLEKVSGKRTATASPAALNALKQHLASSTSTAQGGLDELSPLLPHKLNHQEKKAASNYSYTPKYKVKQVEIITPKNRNPVMVSFETVNSKNAITASVQPVSAPQIISVSQSALSHKPNASNKNGIQVLSGSHYKVVEFQSH